MLIFWLCILCMLVVAMGIIIFSLSAIRKIYLIFSNILFSIIASCLYLHWGNSQQLSNYFQHKQNIAIVANELSRFKSPQAFIDKIKSILQKKPNDARGWFLLGRLYRGTEQYQLAEQAFLRANQLQPNQLDIMQHYVESSYLAHGRLTLNAEKYIHSILLVQPNNSLLLNLLALDAYAREDYKLAIQYWKRLLPQLDAQSEEAKKIVQAIAHAQSKLDI